MGRPPLRPEFRRGQRGGAAPQAAVLASALQVRAWPDPRLALRRREWKSDAGQQRGLSRFRSAGLQGAPVRGLVPVRAVTSARRVRMWPEGGIAVRTLRTLV